MSYNGALMFDVDGPLLPQLPYGTVRSGHFLSGFKELIGRRGGHYAKILDEVGIDCATLDQPDSPISGSAASALLAQCSDKLDDDLFGLHLAEHQSADVYGLVSVLGRAAPTMRVGLECVVDLVPLLHSPGADAELITGNTSAEFRWRPFSDYSSQEQAIHQGLLIAAKLVASLGGPDFKPSYVTSVTNMNRHLDEFERRFRAPVRGRSAACAIGFDASYLDRPLQTSNPIVFGLLSSYVERIKRAHAPTLLEQIEGYVGSSLFLGHCSIDGCASRLGMSSRTVQKRLAALGTSFAEVVEAQRFTTAKRALTDTQLTMDDIAYHLGYSEKSSFCRAFKRWTSMTPRMFRVQAIEGRHN